MGEAISQGKRPSGYSLILCSLAVSVAIVVLFCGFLEPIWETNDDVGMSMIAHGYGNVAYGSPNLLFSNVVWGYLVRWIPEINGVLGYSTATITVLVIVGAVLIYGLVFLGLGYLGAISASVLILARPVLFPQFTINAGLLMVAAVICWHMYERQQEKRVLVIGCLLAFCSYLVRSQEFLLVFALASPLLPWSTLRSRRAPKIAAIVLFVSIALAAGIDRQAYQGDEWKDFNELNPARAPFTDYGAASDLKQRQDILERHDYSSNDIDLIASWFFVDPSIANPGKLNAILKELGPLPTQANSLGNAWLGIKTIMHPTLLSIACAALLLVAIRPGWPVLTVWGLFFASIFVIGLMGRPGVLRVYVPLVSLLVIAPFLTQASWSVWRRRLMLGVIMMAAVINT